MKVYIWSTDGMHSINSLDAKANVCCVQFSPLNRHILAYGSAGTCFWQTSAIRTLLTLNVMD